MLEIQLGARIAVTVNWLCSNACNKFRECLYSATPGGFASQLVASKNYICIVFSMFAAIVRAHREFLRDLRTTLRIWFLNSAFVDVSTYNSSFIFNDFIMFLSLYILCLS